MTPFHRLRFVLRLRGPLRTHPHQGAVVYALLANANRADDGSPSFPEGWLLDVPERGRVDWDAGEAFAFGGTLLDSDSATAGRRIETLARGLVRLGERPAKPGDLLGGNFALESVEDLVAGQPLAPGEIPRSIPVETLDDEIQRILPSDTLTIRLLSPLRLERPAPAGSPGGQFLEAWNFDPRVFANRVLKRFPAIGIARRDGEAPERNFQTLPIDSLDNRLIWIDLAYGTGDQRKRLGGLVGDFRIRLTDPELKAALIWGQYARVGKNLSFGFGDYRILEAGPDPYPCRRTTSLLEYALRPTALDERAKLDVTLQRRIVAAADPAIDRFLEESPFAWRRGLTRGSAIKRIERAFDDGYRFAVRADFDRFFDSIELAQIETRLRAYLADEPFTAAILVWLRAGRPNPELSPLLCKLFLEECCECIDAKGGALVRNADDFLILTRTHAEAERFGGPVFPTPTVGRSPPAFFHYRPGATES